MKKKSVNAVVVGAARVVFNGDTANKIGTYQVRISNHYMMTLSWFHYRQA